MESDLGILLASDWKTMRYGLLIAALFVLPLVTGRAATAAPRVEMQLATAPGFSQLDVQKWYRLLVELNVQNLQIRTLRDGDQPSVESFGQEPNTLYKVTGILTASSELVLPGGRFKVGDRGGLAGWLGKLRELGPPGEHGFEELPFGLREKQLEEAYDELSRPLNFSTKDVKTLDVLSKAGNQFNASLVIDGPAADALTAGPPIAEELNGMTRGTALAYVLRAHGLVLRPRLDADRRLEYQVAVAREGSMWPIGWVPEERRDKVLPDLLEIINVEIADAPLSDVLGSVSERLKVPLLFDYPAMARHGVDVEKASVSLPAARTTYLRILQRTLYQAGLKEELRVDEAEKPFFWITTLKPYP